MVRVATGLVRAQPSSTHLSDPPTWPCPPPVSARRSV